MTNGIVKVKYPGEISAIVGTLKDFPYPPINTVLKTFDRWALALNGQSLADIPGMAFLKIWLRRGTLEPILIREIGTANVKGDWQVAGRSRYKVFPLGLIGHWPAGNIAIQPMLSMTCALLGGNKSLIRIPSGLVNTTERIISLLQQVDQDDILKNYVRMIAFDHGETDLHKEMAQCVDGAMIWGGQQAVVNVRSLPFPPWARLSVYGPRLSVAALDKGAWADPTESKKWCRRLVRDVWQFEQQACSSPQTLFIERSDEQLEEFLKTLEDAFRAENLLHPTSINQPWLVSSVVQARASWLFDDLDHKAVFPETPDWTILLGKGSDILEPIYGKTLRVQVVEDLLDITSSLNHNIQTLGIGISDAQKEKLLVEAAGTRGVDRIVKLGRMHAFGSPWDGKELIKPMIRMVHHISSAE